MLAMLAVSVNLLKPETSTYICATKGGSLLIGPASQIIGLILEFLILTSVARIIRLDASRHFRFLAQVALSSATIVAIISGIFLAYNPEHIEWSRRLGPLLKRDLLLASFIASNVVISTIYLLQTYGLSVLLSTITFSTIYFGQLWQQITHFPTSLQYSFSVVTVITLIAIFGLLVVENRLARSRSQAAIGSSLVKPLVAALTFVSASSLVVMSKDGGSSGPTPNIIHGLISDARLASSQWLKQAASSRSLEEATENYIKRYGFPPPPNFDKWYEFAAERGSVVIDDFDQINHDLQPFWGLKPALIRHMTSHVLDRQWTEVAGLRISGGKAVIGTHVLDTHRWMMEGAADMINTFAEWLPDMDLAFNINDESRVVLSHGDVAILMRDAAMTREKLNSTREFQSFTAATTNTWQSQFMNSTPAYAIDVPSKHFVDASIAPSFDRFGSTSCSPSSRARQWRWWNKRAHCPSCTTPHTTGNFISNWSLSGSVCHQPDLANLHGFHLSPSAFKVTKQLFPIFSQSKIPSFSDILYPSPWNYKDKASYDQSQDMPYDKKTTSLFWRGATSEGYSIRDQWQGMQRQRFVNLLNQPPNSYNKRTKLNASFVDVPQRCGGRDCDHEIANLPFGKPVDFQAHWSHRFLLDMDGAGFSGRFLPFLLSRSAVYRVASFRQWFEDRLTPWVHYIPVDARGREIWQLLEYFGGRGADDAEAIASEGRMSAEKLLRKEDMEIYMFRLLLEWGRVVDDNREEVGFLPDRDGS